MDDKPEKRSRGSSNAKKPSILSRLSFFRSDEDVVPFPSVEDDPVLSPVVEKGRKRKGSLRKAALLGTGRLRLDRRFSTDNKKKKIETPPVPLALEVSPPPISSSIPQPSSSPSPPSSDSSLRLRRRHSALPPPVEIEDWDYSATEWWGWIILLVTWIVFVVGIGSCLEVWSWAWDVGETPYAPPELEDDPTLPIVGYYPALMVLTAVMSWVWVVVAWMGMKYFRHAKYGGD